MINIVKTFLKDYTEPLTCKHCGYKTHFGMAMIFHLLKKENQKPTKNDIIFLIKHSFPMTVLTLILLFFVFIVMFIVYITTYPFWYIHEKLF